MTEKPDSLLITLVICVTIVLLSMVASNQYNNINDRNLMSKNIDTAISKGVDPLSVRCSFADSKDIICVAYASTASTTFSSNKK
jgi:hypothetical protein